MNIDSVIFGLPAGAVLSGTLALAALVSAALAYAVGEQFGPRARLRARLAAIAGASPRRDNTTSASRRTKQVEARLKEAGHGGRARRRLELRLRLEQAGLALSARNFCLVSGLAGAVSATIYLLLGYPPLFAVAVVATNGIGLPRFVLRTLTNRRQRAFTRLFANAIDIIVRGIRSGLPVGECLAIIARESPDPVGAEFKLIVEGQKLGMTLKQALDRACRRMPTADMKFFAIVLNLQQQTGGNLAETLAGLSNLLRGRKKMADKIRAMSSEARMTALIIGVLPFLVSSGIYVLNPAYISLLWTDGLGNVILFGGLIWMAIGLFVMKQMVSFEI